MKTMRAALVAMAICGTLPASAAHAAKLEIGKPAPNFQVTTFDGQLLNEIVGPLLGEPAPAAPSTGPSAPAESKAAP